MATNQDGFVSTDADTQAKIQAMQASAVAQSSQATLNPEDAANAAKFSTPLPPGDPASLRDSRIDPNYIGPTNFGKIQSQYTPYQIEQATTRNEQGDVFWNPNVDINKIPPSASGSANLNTPTGGTPLPTENASVTGVRMSSAVPDTLLGRQQAEAAKMYLGGVNKTIDDLLATQQQMQAVQKAESEKAVGGLMGRFRGMLDSTQYKDQLDRDRKMFEVEKNISTLNTIRGRLADATSALESGLIYEEGRPVRMQLLTGRMSELKKQGIAQINALSGVAEVVRGNINLARAYADDSLNAIKQDNAEKNAAMNTLLDLENAKLIRLTEDEKNTIKERRALLLDESARVEKDKDVVFDLAVKYPSAFAQGGVTFLDDPAAALQKMLPKMAADEKQLFDLDVAKSQASISATNRSNRRSASNEPVSAPGDGAIISQMAEDVAAWRENGYSESDINLALLQLYGGKVKKHNVLTAYVDQVLQGGPKPVTPITPEQALKNITAIEDLKAGGYDAQGNRLPEPIKKDSFWSNLWTKPYGGLFGG